MPRRYFVTPKSTQKGRAALNAWGSDSRHDPIYQYLREVGRGLLLTAEEEKALALRIKTGDKEARDEMISKNLRLVIKIARHYAHRGLPLADLIDEGNLGLMHAVDKFDPDKGFRFSTYATWWIREHIERAIMNFGRTIRLPIHVAKGLNKIKRTYKQLSQKLDHEPSIRDLSAELDIPAKEVDSLLQAEKTEAMGSLYFEGAEESHTISIDAHDGSEISREYGDYELCLYVLQQLMQTELNAQERDILVRRYGLFGTELETLESIGESAGLTRERVRQIQLHALSVIRQKLEREGLDIYLIFEE